MNNSRGGNTRNTATLTASTASTSTGIQCDFPAHADGLSLADLQLFHHFVTSTYSTLAEDDHGYELWQIHVPQWSITFSSILYLILALSALHRAREQPDSHLFIDQADRHFTFGVSSVTSILSQFELNPENAQPVYISAVLICIIYFARGPRPGEFIVFSDAGHAEWLVLLHGVRFILETQRDNIFTGVMAPRETDSDDSMRQQGISPEWQGIWNEDRQHLKELRKLTKQTEHAKLYTHLIDNLIQSFEGVYLKLSFQMDRTGLLPFVIGWLYRLPEEYIGLLQQKEPCALVVFASWSILLHHMRHVWYMHNWGVHVMNGIQHTLHEDWKDWISWPMKRIELIEPG